MATTSTPTLLPPLTESQVEDLLYCARAGETDDFSLYLDELVESLSGDEEKVKGRRQVVEMARDADGNSMLHYAAANGHLATLKILYRSSTLTTLLHRNSSGNTPLHWASLNGHLATVQSLVAQIEELEQASPTEAEGLRAVADEEERVVRREKRRKMKELELQQKKAEKEDEQNQQPTSTASTVDAAKPTSTTDVTITQEEVLSGDNDNEDEDDSPPPRSLWDIRNVFGRGPTSEAQLNERESVVQFLLNHMVAGPSNAYAPAPASEEHSQSQSQPPKDEAGKEEATEKVTEGMKRLSTTTTNGETQPPPPPPPPPSSE